MKRTNRSHVPVCPVFVTVILSHFSNKRSSLKLSSTKSSLWIWKKCKKFCMFFSHCAKLLNWKKHLWLFGTIYMVFFLAMLNWQRGKWLAEYSRPAKENAQFLCEKEKSEFSELGRQCSAFNLQKTFRRRGCQPNRFCCDTVQSVFCEKM